MVVGGELCWFLLGLDLSLCALDNVEQLCSLQ